MNHSYWATQSAALREELVKTRKALWEERDRAKALAGIALLGWVLFVLVLVWPAKASASELAFTSIVIRCQQSDDTCVKRELAYPTEAACDEANAAVVEAIGSTSDIVIAYCVGDSE